jgi:exo-1,4-beta-D-glucosaminidase
MLSLNFNAIRTEGFWGTDHFFDLCDKYGIMIFDGPNCCSIWERWDAWSDRSYEIAGLSLRDQVIRKRNHPSFINWLLSSDNPLPLRAEKLYTEIIDEYDGTRPYQSNSMYSTTPFCGCTGVDHDPYPETYIYLHPTVWYGLKDSTLSPWGEDIFGKYEFLEFNTEIGPGGEQIPPMESMRAMMPQEDLWPINKTWEVRQSSDEYSVNATNAFNYRYGKPSDLESYTVKAQVFQKESYRSMAEAFRKNKYAASGILIYRLNAGWPSLCYFLYDYYLRPNGAYAAIQQAFEPVHIQYSYDDSTVVVVNDLHRQFRDMKVSAGIYNFDMTEKHTIEKTINLAPDDVERVCTLPLDMEGLSETHFLRLTLEDHTDRLISTNFYWLSKTYDTLAQFTDLMDLPQTSLSAVASYEENGKQSVVTVDLTNETGQLAFFINPKILKGLHGDELLPAYWDTKYFSLLPGETREICVIFDSAELMDEPPYLLLEGWNTDPLELSITENKEVTPKYAYRDLLAARETGTGNEFEVSVSVVNTAKNGKGLLKSRQFLIIDGQPFAYKRVALAPGEEKQLKWSGLKLDEKGTHRIRVGTSETIEIEVK